MRTKYALYNFLVATITSVILPVLGFVKVRLFIDLYGSELNGLYLVMTQVIAYLNICEIAFSFAFRQLLYKPLAENDRQRVLEIYYGARKVFKVVGLLVLVLGIAAGFGITYFTDSPVGALECFGLFMTLFLPFSISYFLMGPNFVIMADQKEYKINIWIQSILIIRMALMIFVILAKLPYYLIFLIEGLQVLIGNSIAYVVAKKNYPWLDEKVEFADSKAFVNNSKYTLVHRLANIANNNTDNIVVSLFLNLKAVSIYGAYSYLTEAVVKIVNSAVTSPINSLGNMFNDDNADTYGVFTELYSFACYVGSLIAVCMFVALDSFILIWMGNADYVLPLMASAIFALNIYYLTQREPVVMSRDTTGYFKKAVGNAYLMSFVKIVLSIVFIKMFGVVGVLAATFVSYWVVDLFYNPILVYRFVFKLKELRYYRMFAVRLAVTVLAAVLIYGEWLVVHGYFGAGIMSFLLSCVIIGISALVLITALYYVCFRSFRMLVRRFAKLFSKRV